MVPASSPGSARAKVRAEELVARHRELLLSVSHSIWEHPELCFEEHHAHDLLVEALAGAGLAPTPHAHGLPTAFVAEAGSEGPCVAVLLEYDALPDIGHACGHNVIAAAGLGAGLALAGLAAEQGGRVRIIGTPAEEGGGGKEFLIRAGAFDGVDAAMMVHPADRDLPTMRAIAIQELNVTYEGRASHAAAAPELGRNALDAAVLGYVNVAALRQHIGTGERVHGIFTDAGEKPNIVPRRAAAQWYVRSDTLDSLAELKQRVLSCLEGGATASGCTMEHTWKDPAYADMVDDPWLMAAWAANAADLDRTPLDPAVVGDVVGSTDMGNVSHLVPSIHPMLAVAPAGVSIHTPEFAAFARGPEGDRAVLDGAVLMARTAIDRWAAGPVGATEPPAGAIP
ncbi:MAG: M20 family metallopeptidase [Microthrixaceae bacterium]